MTKSLYDPTRETVGSEYLKAQSNTDRPIVGDMNHELLKGLLDDINETAASNPFEGRPFYILIDEKRDLQMKNLFKRRILRLLRRPFPEPGSQVWYVDPKSSTLEFCWDLPQTYHMPNILMNFTEYDKDFIADIRAWKKSDWAYFGIKKEGDCYMEIENFPNRKLKNSALSLV